VPTKKPRYTITETGDVAQILESLRAAGEPMTSRHLADLVVRGGEARLRELDQARADEQRRRQLREGFLALTADEIDVPALQAAHERGWAH
jgi:hypothetical protein